LNEFDGALWNAFGASSVLDSYWLVGTKALVAPMLKPMFAAASEDWISSLILW
jgi:hypothetical protein